MALTNCQVNAIQVFDRWLVSGKKFMVLKGPAGVGKTFVLKEMLKNIQNPNLIMTLLGRDPITKTALTALTNKAAEVFADAMGPGTEVSTIHSFMKLGIKNDFSTGRSKLIHGKDYDIIRDTLVVIDECSMVDLDLMKFIHKTFANCKILFMGDEPQLGPIFEKISPVFELPVDDCEYVEMHEVVRNRGVPALQQLCTDFRQVVLSGQFTSIPLAPGAVELLDDDLMQQHMNTDFVLGQRMDASILAYTNDRVQLYNQYIRDARGLPEIFQRDERLINNVMTRTTAGSPVRIEQAITVFDPDAVHDDPYIKELGWDVPTYLVDTSAGTLRQPVNYAQVSWVLKQIAKSAKQTGSWAPYFTVKERFSDLRMPQAKTVYKAQGSTYHTVYVDLADIGICKDPAQAARLLYVAFTRASHRVYLFGQLPTRFQGLIP